VQIHPGFQQMRGKAMAQRMDAFAVGDPRDPLGVVVNSVRLNFCLAVELSNASDQYGRPLLLHSPTH